jgi:vacuolar-type H+-ATPase subunit E/Vma4
VSASTSAPARATERPGAGPPAPRGLEPLREALLRGAHAEAERLVSDAEAQGEAVVAQARAFVEDRLAQARALGQAEALERRERQAAADRRDERSRLLRARAEAHDDLVRQARGLVAQLLTDPTRRRGLEARLRALLGEDAAVVPTPDGGLLGRDASGTTVDASVTALVDEVLSGLDLEDLWTPR